MAADMSFNFITLLSILIRVISINAGQDYTYVTITTSAGPVRGVKDLKKNYTKFLGIPYARVNMTNPFGPSIPQRNVSKVFDATRDKVPCPQTDFPDTYISRGSLDCLHLNIFIPNVITKGKPIPVLVFIHGGKHESGRIQYGPQWLVRNGIIVVFLQYRLGIYGFLCLDTPEVPANQGLKDQVEALRWINKNIDSFGGDRNRITISGHSSGSQDVHLHLLSDNELLYHQVIFQSGNSLYPFFYKDYNETIPFILAGKFGCETKDLHEALQFLSTLEPAMLVAVSKMEGIEYGPCVERHDSNKFINNFAINEIKMTKFKNINAIFIQVYDECAYTYCNLDKNLHNSSFELLLSNIFDVNDKELEKLIEIVSRFYVRDFFEGDVEKPNIDFLSDAWMNYNNKRFLKRMLKSGARKVYFGIFSYDGKRNVLKKAMKAYNVDYPIHGDDLGYLFDMPIYMLQKITEDDRVIIDRITTMWANFVKYGNPTPNTTELLPVKWKPITHTNPQLNFLEIGRTISMKNDFYTKRMTFWELLFEIYGIREKHLN